jgi:iron complex outermembrane receptor protein
LQCNAGNSSQTDCLNFNLDREMHAWQLGLRQTLSAQWSAFVNQGQSFRLPNSDDLASVSAPLNPQVSHDQQIGLEWSHEQASLRVAVFRSDVTDEIHYLPNAFNLNDPGISGANTNLSPTRHQGAQLEGQLPLSRTVSLNGNLTWQQAFFRSGMDGSADLTNNHIPMVPAVMANLGLSWQATGQDRLSMAVVYVGAQRMDGDEDNTFGAQVPSYTVVNAKIQRQFSKSISGTLSVNNLFDRHYATYGSDWNYGTAYSLFPGNPRDLQASLTWSF